jgi:hypothetical protein
MVRKASKKTVESVEHTLAAQVGSVAATVTTPEHKGKVTEALAKKRTKSRFPSKR